jgi:cell division transport system permease protein
MNKTPFKRRVIALGRIIKTGFINSIRSAWLAIAATAVMVITLTILLFSAIANVTFAHTIQTLEERIDISVYLKDSVSVDPAQRDKLIADIRQIGNVKSVEYVSKEQALESYRKQNEGNLDLLVAISQTDNPLPASLQIKPHDVNQIQDIQAYLERPEIREMQSDETSYSGPRKEAIDKITASTRFFRTAGVVGVVIFTIISVLIIFNTIRMAIFNRRDELTIMRLLGANTWYIRGPFIVETIMYGIVAAVLSVTVALQAKALNASSLGLLDVRFASDYFRNHYWRILGAQLLIGVLIGALSSFIATRRYLKFKAPK